MTTISFYQIIADFPHKSLIDRESYYQITHVMQNLLDVNASTLTMTLGRGNHSYIGIIMQDMLYTTIYLMPYLLPVDPGGTSTVTNKATTEQHLQLQD